MQLQTGVKTEEGIAWVRLLENILTVVDPVKIESVTDGEWLKTITRCTIYLLGTSGELTSCDDRLADQRSRVASTIFAASLPVMMRLGVLNADTSGLVHTALLELQRLEQPITISRSEMLTQHADAVSVAPYRSNRLHETRTKESLQLWREGVEALWLVTMNSEKKDSDWDALTCRMLVCRSIVGERSADVCEWMRREVVQNLRSWEK
jgi:nucleolar pre-ribosomal-associated protein 1